MKIFRIWVLVPVLIPVLVLVIVPVLDFVLEIMFLKLLRTISLAVNNYHMLLKDFFLTDFIPLFIFFNLLAN